MSEKANMLIIPTYRCQLSPLDTQQRARGYPTIVNNIQPCPKLCLLMPLARVGARTDSTTSYSYNTRRGQLPRTRIDIVRRTRARHAVCAEGLHFSVFHLHSLNILLLTVTILKKMQNSFEIFHCYGKQLIAKYFTSSVVDGS